MIAGGAVVCSYTKLMCACICACTGGKHCSWVPMFLEKAAKPAFPNFFGISRCIMIIDIGQAHMTTLRNAITVRVQSDAAGMFDIHHLTMFT